MLMANIVLRFWTKVERQDPDVCWFWTGKLNDRGYGRFRIGGHWVRVHRFAYETLVGPIPAHLEIDHRCHNADLACLGGRACLHRRCVNPAHLETVTNHENIRRGKTGQWRATKTHCPQGHPYSGANLFRRPDGARECRVCKRESVRHSRNRPGPP